VRGLFLAVLLMGLATEASSAQNNNKPVTHTVVITGTAFKPATLTVKAGERVVWKNDDPFAHTVTSQKGHFDSKEVAAGQSWTYEATRTGEFPYICTLHRTMKGTLIVQ
jgi:plastocyanin